MEQYQHQIQRLENRVRDQRDSARKKRNHRLITRGGAVESIVPEVRGMSERTFFSSYGAGLFPVGGRRPGTPRSKGTGCCRRRGSMCRPPHDRPARGRLIGSVSLPRHPGQAECGAVRCRLRRLPRRGEATQRVLRSNQRLHPQGRRGLHRHSPAATSPCRVPRPCTLWNAVEKAKSARINELKELLRLAAFCRNAKPIYDQEHRLFRKGLLKILHFSSHHARSMSNPTLNNRCSTNGW